MLDSQKVIDTVKMVITDIVGLLNVILEPFGYRIDFEGKKIDKI